MECENNNELMNRETILAKTNEEDIKNLIYTIRGKQVMLDSDVARLYHYPTKRINETVRRNKERFPEKFCFQLNENELENYGGRRYLPYVFTEQGIAMLSGLLKNEIAVQVSINIMDAFVEMRKFIINNANIFNRLTTVEYKLLEHDRRFDDVFNVLQKNKDVKVVILTSDKTNILKLDVQKFNKEYPTLEVATTDKFHDRFIVIDNKELYHVGASLKDLGKKCFAISKIEDVEYIEKIQNFSKNT